MILDLERLKTLAKSIFRESFGIAGSAGSAGPVETLGDGLDAIEGFFSRRGAGLASATSEALLDFARAAIDGRVGSDDLPDLASLSTEELTALNAEAAEAAEVAEAEVRRERREALDDLRDTAGVLARKAIGAALAIAAGV